MTHGEKLDDVMPLEVRKENKLENKVKKITNAKNKKIKKKTAKSVDLDRIFTN